MGVEDEALKYEFGDVKAQDLDDLRACDAECGVGIVGVVSIDQGFGVSAGFSEVEEMSGIGGDGIAVLQVGCLHGGRLSLDKVLMSVEGKSEITGTEEVLVWDIL